MDTSTTTITALSQALDLGSARVQAISNNISNINTPGYKRQDATFAALLESAGAEDTSVTQAAPDPRDLSLDAPNGGQRPAFVTQRSGSMRTDGNNVDIDAETSRLAAAEIYYSGAMQLLNGQFSNLKYVIGGA